MSFTAKLIFLLSKQSRALFDGLKAFEGDPEVGAIIVTGAGRGFCAGADMGGLARGAAGEAVDSAQIKDDRTVMFTTTIKN